MSLTTGFLLMHQVTCGFRQSPNAITQHLHINQRSCFCVWRSITFAEYKPSMILYSGFMLKGSIFNSYIILWHKKLLHCIYCLSITYTVISMFYNRKRDIVSYIQLSSFVFSLHKLSHISRHTPSKWRDINRTLWWKI